MPYGGVSNSQGLQVQQTTPGVSQTGNVHISGVGLADTFLAAEWAPSGSTLTFAQKVLRYGYSQTLGSWTNSNQNNTYTMIGNSQTANFNPNGNQQNACVMIGDSVLTYQGGGTVLGSQARSGDQGQYPSPQAYNVVIGWQASAWHVGGLASASTVIGAQTGETTSTLDASTLVGRKITSGNKGKNAGFGRDHTFGAFTNCIFVGMLGKTANQDNEISLGDNTHTKGSVGGRPLDWTRRAIVDANATLTASDYTVAYTTLTAARTVTLPAANAVPAGQIFQVTDETGNCSAVNTITITPAGADTFNGGAAVMNAAYSVRTFYSDGATKWIVLNSH